MCICVCASGYSLFILDATVEKKGQYTGVFVLLINADVSSYPGAGSLKSDA